MMQRLIIFCFFTFTFGACHSQHEKKEDTVIAFHFKPLTATEKEKYAESIAPLYQKLLLQKGFNGSILLAKNGEIIFEDYHGYKNFSTKESITAETPFHLASISKTFTGMTILHLMEEGKIKLDDPLQTYFPNFPYQNITVRLLLSHRSGLPKYEYAMENKKAIISFKKNKKGKNVRVITYVDLDAKNEKAFVTNEDLLKFLIDKKPPLQFTPNRAYLYCNTNFALLALIIEKVTGMSYPKYMKDSVFTPLGLKNTFVFNENSAADYVPSYNYNNTAFKMEKFDFIYGDKNIYSTVRDLQLWDNALYEAKFVSSASLQLAFQPYSYDRKLGAGHYYGLAWHLFYDNVSKNTIVYHNGWWHGNNTVFTRYIKDSATLIILGNKFNRNIYHAKEIGAVFSQRIDTSAVDE